VAKQPSRKFSLSPVWITSAVLLFFVLYYVSLWQVVDLRLICHGGGIITNFPVFFRGWTFFQGFLSYAGGPVDYISAFLSQFLCIRWAGALVTTLQAWLLWLCAAFIMRTINGWRPLWICSLIPVFLMALYALCVYLFTAAMALLATFAFACLYMLTASKNRTASILIFLILSLVVYVTASWAYLLFAVLCAMYELVVKRRLLNSVVYLAGAPIVSYIAGILIFDASVIESFSRFRPFPVTAGHGFTIIIYIFFLFLPIVTAVFWLLGLLGISPSGRFSYITKGKVPELIGISLPFVIGIAAVCVSYNSRLHTMLEVDYYGSQKMWPKVIEAMNRNPGQKFPSKMVNLALYHSDRFAEDMFYYPQSVDALFMDRRTGGEAYWGLYDTFIDLGHINIAEYSLFMCIETYGEQPIFLKRLAMVSMVKGDINAARIYLGALGKTIFDAGWASDYLKKIEQDPNLSADKDVRYLRSVMVEKDRGDVAINTNMIQDLLDKNRHNRMAFEYLMGYYLLNGQFEAFTENLNRLDDFEYKNIPKIFEEAILFYNYTKKKQLDLGSRKISNESQQRFAGFLGIYLGRYNGDRNAAYEELAKNYGDSYFFYCIYRQSGKKI
jgi:hypothetical protein